MSFFPKSNTGTVHRKFQFINLQAHGTRLMPKDGSFQGGEGSYAGRIVWD